MAVQMPAPIAPLSRTSGYYAKSWLRFVRPGRSDIPATRPTASLAAHAFLDELLLTGFRAMSRGVAEIAPGVRAEAEAAASIFEREGWLDDPASYHRTPPPLAESEVRIRAVRGMSQRFEVLTFDSGYAPWAAEPGRERWLGYEGNRRARAWLLRHDEPRPWVVCVHGAKMGTPNVDLTLFHTRWLHEELGLNVVLPVQPLHGRRRRGAPAGTSYPGGHVLDNVHGAAQAVWDVRRVLSWIRGQDSAAPIALTGVSLGGWVGSLVASLDADLSCVILGAPVVDLVGLMENHAPPGLDEEFAAMVDAARAVGTVVSPLALQPAIAHDRRFLYAGLADRVVHPHHQIRRLWHHWDQPSIHWYQGGHVLFFRSGAVQEFVHDALARSGTLERRQLIAASSGPT